MDRHKALFDSDKYKEAVDDYLSGAFETGVEPQHIRERNPLDETVAMHIKRNELLLNEPPVHNTNDYHANLHAQLLNTVREKRVNKYQNRGDEMRDNIRQLFEINSQLQSMLNQAKNEVQRPPQEAFINTKEFHDDSYSKFLEDMEARKNMEE